MNEGSSVLEEIVINEDKLKRLEILLNNLGIKSYIEEINGIKILVDSNGTNLFTVAGNCLYYAVNPYGTFKITSFELDIVKDELGLRKSREVLCYSKGILRNQGIFKGYFSLVVKTSNC